MRQHFPRLRDDFGLPKSVLAKREFARYAKTPKTARFHLGKQPDSILASKATCAHPR
jgi:hypothetical protein